MLPHLYNRVSLAVLLFVGACQLQAQTRLLGIRANPNEPVLFFDTAGRQAFRLPSEFYFTPWQPDVPNAKPKSLRFMVFEQTPIVLKSDAIGYVLVDGQGRITDTLGYEYSDIGPFSGNLAPARLNRGGYQGMPLSVFLNTKGQPAFGKRRFYRIQPFVDGLAAVQEESPQQPFQLLNEKGETVLSLPEATGTNVARVFPMREGLRQVLLRYPRGYNYEEWVYRYQYYNRAGQLQFELNTLFPDTEILSAADGFDNGISSMLVAADPPERCAGLVFFDTTGTTVYTHPCVLQSSTFQHGKALFSIPDTSSRARTLVLGRDGAARPLLPDDTLFTRTLATDIAGGRYEEVQLLDESTQTFVPKLLDRNAGHFIQRDENRVVFAQAAEFGPYVQVREYPAGEEYADNVLLQRPSLQAAFRSPKHILTVFGNTVLLADPTLDEALLPNELVQLNGKLLWSKVKKHQFNLGIDEALRHAPAVRSLSLNDETGLPGIATMPNLESLHLWHVRGETLPAAVFKAAPKLKTLVLYDCRRLKKLPPIPSVQALTIQGAGQLSGLETVISAAKNLKTLILADSAPLDPLFLQALKTKRPGLSIRFSTLQYEVQEEAPTLPPNKH
ncbi:MAG: hypothetical protein IT260_21730 [Saprospiraceae bacterium]|nr:hypothetical protein [Saprospiraceae bacterium]